MTFARRLWRVLTGIVREISDQAPYQRYLRTHACQHSPEEWRKFCDDRSRQKFQRPKCC